jgi:hypothetical protein
VVIVCHSLPIQLNLIIRALSTFMIMVVMVVVSVCISQVFSHDWSRCHQCYRGYQSNSCHKCYFPIIIFIHISAGYSFYLQSYKQSIQMPALEPRGGICPALVEYKISLDPLGPRNDGGVYQVYSHTRQ